MKKAKTIGGSPKQKMRHSSSLQGNSELFLALKWPKQLSCNTQTRVYQQPKHTINASSIPQFQTGKTQPTAHTIPQYNSWETYTVPTREKPIGVGINNPPASTSPQGNTQFLNADVEESYTSTVQSGSRIWTHNSIPNHGKTTATQNIHSSSLTTWEKRPKKSVRECNLHPTATHRGKQNARPQISKENSHTQSLSTK